MIFYIIAFGLCVFIGNKQSLKTRNHKVTMLLQLLLFVFLCFGYMTGSDWRNYELRYTNQLSMAAYEEHEWAFILLVKFANYITSDFWIFTGVLKILFILSLLSFFSNFTQKTWLSLGFAFFFHLLFIVIDCPLRFMVSLTFLLFSFKYFLNRNWIRFICIAAPSVLFHVTSIAVIALIISGLLAKYVAKAPRWLLLSLFGACVAVSALQSLYSMFYDRMGAFLLFSKFAETDNYLSEGVQGFNKIGTYKNIILGLFIIFNRDNIKRITNGSYLFYYAFLYYCLAPVFDCIPTSFRLNIINGFCAACAFAELFSQAIYKRGAYKMIKISICAVFLIVLAKDVSQDYRYTPYSNSIPYIMTGHLPYSYRDNHNPSINPEKY